MDRGCRSYLALSALLLAACGQAPPAGSLAVGTRYVLRAPDGSCPDEYQPHTPGAPPPGVTDVRLTVSGGGLAEPVSAKFAATAERIAIEELPAGNEYELKVEAISGLDVTWSGGATNIRVLSGRTTRVGLLLTRVGGLTCTAGAMLSARFLHTATLLPNGEVLLAGGFTAIGSSCGTGCVELPATAEAELFNPLTGEFKAAGTMRHARALHAAVGLDDGRVLIVGGTGSGAEWADLAPFAEFYLDAQDEALTTLEIWDPQLNGGTGGFGSLQSISPGRLRASAARLADGSALVLGGLDLTQTGAARADALLFDPDLPGGGGVVNSQLPLAAGNGRLAGTATALPDGRALAWGGSAVADPFAETFEPGASPAQHGFSAFRAADSRGLHLLLHTATMLPDGRILVAGGITPDGTGYAGPDRQYSRLVSLADAGRILDHTNGAPQLAVGRFAHSAASVAGDGVLLAGGYSAISGDTLDSVEIWRTTADSDFHHDAALSEPRAFLTATPLADGTVLLAGGRRSASGVSRAAEIYRAE